MKKYIILILIISFISSVAYAEDLTSSPVLDPQDVIFRSSLTQVFNDVSDNSEEYVDDKDFKVVDKNNMPFFKQMRIRLSNKYLDVSTRSERAQKNGYTYTPKWKFWDKKRGTYTPIVVKSEDGENPEKLTENVPEQESENSEGNSDLSFESGINTEITENQLMLDSENVYYDDETGDMVATGRPILHFPQQNTTVIADKMIYNDDGNILKGLGDVYVLKDGKPLTSTYLEIDMNEESMYMDSIVLSTINTKLTAKRASQQEGLIVLYDGNMKSEKSGITRIASRMIGPRFEDMIVSPDAQSLFFGNPEGNNLNVHIDEINIDARKNHDIIKAKNIKFYHKDKYLFRIPGLTTYTNKQRDYFEGNYPEFGSRRKMGMFIGPGFVFSGPGGSVIKAIPFLNYKKDFGIGGMLKFVHPNNRTELGYGSSQDIFFLRGKQRLDDNLFLHYAANSYTDEWFLGARMAKYMAELYYDKSYVNKDFLGKDKDLTFRHRASFGLMEDDDRSFNGEKFSEATGMSTTRTRYMAGIAQNIFKYENIENRVKVDVGVDLQGSAALYGTGDTQFVARIGPYINTQYKNWMQSLSYYLTGYHDESPMPRYDAYRYGSQSIRLTEAFRLHKYVSVGWSGYVNVSDDSPNGKMFQENAFLVSLGPDDFKIILGYDFVRERTYFGFNVAFDPKGTNVAYDKMIIRNPERLGQTEESEDPEQQIAFATSKTNQEENEHNLYNRSGKAPLLKYAQVIDIEDPNKERIE